jgi:hypothetical protein
MVIDVNLQDVMNITLVEMTAALVLHIMITVVNVHVLLGDLIQAM